MGRTGSAEGARAKNFCVDFVNFDEKSWPNLWPNLKRGFEIWPFGHFYNILVTKTRKIYTKIFFVAKSVATWPNMWAGVSDLATTFLSVSAGQRLVRTKNGQI